MKGFTSSMESEDNPVLIIENFRERGQKDHIAVVVDQVKQLGQYRYVWPENEAEYSFEERCRHAMDRQHSHQGNIEFVYVFRGSAINYINGKGFPLQQGDFFLMSKSVYHGIALEDDTVIMNILFDPGIMENLYSDPVFAGRPLARVLMRNAVEEQVADVWQLSTAGSEDVFDYLYLILKETFFQTTFSQKINQYNLMGLLSLLIRLEEQQAKSQDEKKESQKLDIYELYSYINEHLSTVTLRDAAVNLHYSETALSRLVKKETGSNFSTIVRSMKLKKARALLANSQLSVEEIAMMMNYTNRFTFDRAFTKEFGLSPKEYRQSLQQGDLKL